MLGIHHGGWVEPLPHGVRLLRAEFENGRLQLEVAGAAGVRSRTAIARRFETLGEVDVLPRCQQPRRCIGHMPREDRRLQLRYVHAIDEHMDTIMVAEDSEKVVVFGVMCVPEIADADDREFDSPYHVYLDEPLGDRVVIDGFTGDVVPYKNVYTAIKLELGQPLDERDMWLH